MRRCLIALMAAAPLVLAAGCGSHPAPSPASPAAATSAAPLTPLQKCQVTVMILLAKTVAATQQGYPDGIDLTQVMDQYGSNSAVFQTFAQSDGQVLLYVSENGPDGALHSVAGLVHDYCQQFGA